MPALRHNPGMRSLLPALAVLGGLFIATSCGRDAPSPDVPPAQEGGRLEWQGRLACADCDGIETVLVLRHEGGQRSYRLTETYLATDGDGRFVDAGRWEAEAGLIRMDGDTGSLRVYALLHDGRLQGRDGEGRRLPGRRGDVLAPVAPDRR